MPKGPLPMAGIVLGTLGALAKAWATLGGMAEFACKDMEGGMKSREVGGNGRPGAAGSSADLWMAALGASSPTALPIGATTLLTGLSWAVITTEFSASSDMVVDLFSTGATTGVCEGPAEGTGLIVWGDLSGAGGAGSSSLSSNSNLDRFAMSSAIEAAIEGGGGRGVFVRGTMGSRTSLSSTGGMS